MAPLDPFPGALQGWQNFYMLAGTAAATLTGLMFVAVTFGSSLVKQETAQSTRAFLDPTYMHFVQVLFTACLMTIPTLGPALLGGLLIAIGAFRLVRLRWVFGSYREAQRQHGDIELSDWVMSIALPLLCHALLIATGAAFVLRSAAALSGLAVVILMLLFVGIHGAWELFVWMAIAVSQRRGDPRP
ncbi:MAG TPA: hypothetical protein VH044_08620 [Polyangiaceae bacterium]|jgi:hypothetical protein|nr:hypothetical protein [Polyangiaceae bacterium]